MFCWLRLTKLRSGYESIFLTRTRQSSTINTRALGQYQDVGRYQSEQLVAATQGIETNHRILTTNADLLLSLKKAVDNTSTQKHTQELQDIMLMVLESNLQIFGMGP